VVYINPSLLSCQWQLLNDKPEGHTGTKIEEVDQETIDVSRCFLCKAIVNDPVGKYIILEIIQCF